MQDSFAYVRRDNEITIYRCYSQHKQIEIPEYIEDCPVTGIADHCFAAEASVLYRKDEIRMTGPMQEVRYMQDLAGPMQEVQYTQDLAGQMQKSQAVSEQTEQTQKPQDAQGLTVQTQELQDAQEGSGPELAPLVSTGVTALILPPQLKRVGNYAFYGCHDLKKISFPKTPFRLGSGVFVDCSHIQQLILAAEPADNSAGFITPPCMREVLREIEYELETVIVDPEQEEKIFCRLYYPGYIEETIENTPARIIEVRYEGTGFKYRQCFRDGQIDFAQYDSHLYLMSVQENLYTSIPLTLDRLRTPVLLDQKMKEKYMAFLQKEYKYLAQYLMSGSMISGLEEGGICYDAVRDLCSIGYFTEDIIGGFIELAGEKSMPQIVSLLMNYRREHFAKKKKTYDF